MGYYDRHFIPLQPQDASHDNEARCASLVRALKQFYDFVLPALELHFIFEFRVLGSYYSDLLGVLVFLQAAVWKVNMLYCEHLGLHLSMR